jgi:hypothetical protein
MASATHAETAETILNSSCPIAVDESANALPPDEFKSTPIPLPYQNHIHNELAPMGEAVTASAYVGDVDETIIAITCVDVLNHEVPVTDDTAELIVNASADRDLIQNLCVASNSMNETVEVVQVDLEENMSSKPNDNTVAVISCPDLLKEIKNGNFENEEITHQLEVCQDQGPPVSVNNDNESGCDICDSRDSTIELDTDNLTQLENHSKQLDDFVEQKELEVTISPQTIDTNFDDPVSIPEKALNILPRATVNPQIRTSTGGKRPDKFAGTKVGVAPPRVATMHTSRIKPNRIENGNTHSQQKNPRARTCTALPRVAMLYKTMLPSQKGKRTKESRGDLSLIIRRNGSHVYTSNFVEKHGTTGASSPYTRSVPPAAMEDELLPVPPRKAPNRESDGGAACPDVLLREGALEEAAADKSIFASIAAVGSSVSPTDVRKLDSITDTNNAMVPANLDTTAF